MLMKFQIWNIAPTPLKTVENSNDGIFNGFYVEKATLQDGTHIKDIKLLLPLFIAYLRYGGKYVGTGRDKKGRDSIT